ncbi:MAG: CHAT domain-containing protein [Deltaproteobacteria bacterium]|nr:CHAT domain-containing protein [Deltaproteobacteria bacterium]
MPGSAPVRGAGRTALLVLVALLTSGGTLATETEAGDRAFDQGALSEALEHWQRALAVAERTGDPTATFEALLRVGAGERRLGDLDGAEVALGEAERLAEGLGPVAQARAWDAQGLLAQERGDSGRAERLLTRAFDAHKAARQPSGAAGAALNLGLVRMERGDSAGARGALDASVQLFQALGDARGLAEALATRGVASRRAGALTAARQDLELALATYLPDQLDGRMAASQSLALVYLDLGQTARARAALAVALPWARALDDPTRAAALEQGMGALEAAAGDLPAARAHYAAAEAGWSAGGRPAEALSAAMDLAALGQGDAAALRRALDQSRALRRPALEARAALQLATLALETDPDAAEPLADRALQLALRHELVDLRWRARAAVGIIAVRRGELEEGIPSLREAVDELERARDGLEDHEQRAFLLSHEPVYRALIDALLRQGDPLGAFVYTERLQLATLGRPPLPDDPQVAHYQRLIAQEASLSSALEGAVGGPPQREEALRAQLATLRVEFASTVDELRASYPHFEELVRVDPEDLEALQADLEPGLVVLQPVLFDDRLVLMVFSRDRLVAREVPVEAEEVGRTLRRLARLLQKWEHFHDPEELDRLAAQAGAWLLDPIAEDLAGAEVIAVSATGVFRQLPFAMLRTDGRYLIEQAAVVSVTHVGSLRPSGLAPFRVQGARTLLLGDPDGTLPHAEREVEQIAAVFPGATTLAGGEATRQALLAHLEGKTVLHLATHAYLDPRQPTQSFLVLAGTETLQYGEIPGLAPYLGSARLAVLSACESGLPVEARGGPDGDLAVSIHGLAAQFRRAGVETLVASLWRVDDRATEALMERFYRALSEEQDVAHALRSAQLALIADPSLSEPTFWAAFSVVGDWR